MLFILYLLAPLHTRAQPLSERAAAVSGDDFSRAFLGNCAQNVGHYRRVIDAAKALGFADLPDSMRPLIAPKDPKAAFVGFFVQSGDGAPYFLGVSKGTLNGKTIVTCAISNPYIDVKKVVSSITHFMNLKSPNEDETSMGQRYRIWRIDDVASDAFVSLTDAQPMGYGGVTIAISAPLNE